jgi:hypothetical protein
MKIRMSKTLLWTGMAAITLVAAGAALWVHNFHHYTPLEVMKDVQAGIAAGHIADPRARVERFLETRYGPLTEAANREQAFLDFFNVDHIKGLNFIVNHTSPRQRQADTQAMAQWIAGYRKSMSPEEKAALNARLGSDSGRTMRQQATAEYRSQDVFYQGAQKPVIAELLTTLSALQKQ